jgi:hypothetical protein
VLNVVTVMHTALHLMRVLCVIFCTRFPNAPKEERYIPNIANGLECYKETQTVSQPYLQKG